MTINHKVKIV